MSNVLEIQQLCKNYQCFALQNVSITLQQGLIMGFIGPNGAGKTTTIKAILHMINYQSGTITLFGESGKPLRHDWLGVVLDEPNFSSDWSIGEVERAISPFYNDWDNTTFTQYLMRFALPRTKRVKELSRGMKVKLMLAVALSHNARLLILDEPTSGLDPVARDELCEILKEYVADEVNSVLFSTHITADLEKIADCITYIVDGKIVFTGFKDDLLESYLRIAGDAKLLHSFPKELIIGWREHHTGFEGMIAATDSHEFGDAFLLEKLSLDDIVVFMNRKAGVAS